MITFKVKADLREVERYFKDYQKNVVPKAAARAMNRAIDGVKTAAVRDIAAQTKLKQADIRKRMIVRGATPQRLVASIEALPYAPNLSSFSARQNKQGVAATAWERRKTYRHAFMLPNGRVVTRTTNKRFPLKGLRGPSLPSTFMKKRTIEVMERIAGQRWRSEFQRELARRTGAAFK